MYVVLILLTFIHRERLLLKKQNVIVFIAPLDFDAILFCLQLLCFFLQLSVNPNQVLHKLRDYPLEFTYQVHNNRITTISTRI